MDEKEQSLFKFMWYLQALDDPVEIKGRGWVWPCKNPGIADPKDLLGQDVEIFLPGGGPSLSRKVIGVESFCIGVVPYPLRLPIGILVDDQERVWGL